MEVRSDALVQICDLKTTHEEVDDIIQQQVVALADMGCKTINVICNDIYVFVLLAHYFAEERWKACQCHWPWSPPDAVYYPLI